MKFKEINTSDLKLNNTSRLQCMHGCIHYKRNPMCPPACPCEDELTELVKTYSKALILHQVIEYSGEMDLLEKRKTFNDNVILQEHEVKMDGHYYALSFLSGPCSTCEGKICSADACYRGGSGRMSICASNVDLMHLAQDILGYDFNEALTFWKTNLSESYFDKGSNRYLCMGMILF